VVVLALTTSLLTGCGSPRPSAQNLPLPPGRLPSKVSTSVCAPGVQHEIATALGVKADVAQPTWVGHLYSCRYRYPDGTLTLSVKELSSWPQTYAYFHTLGSQLGDTSTIPELGQGAFTTKDGSVVVRRDWKVLLVDISGLPPQFGQPPDTPAEVAGAVAAVILGLWEGAPVSAFS